MAFHNRPDGIIKAGFVVEKIKSYVIYVSGIQLFLINLGDEYHIRGLIFYLLDQPLEELPRHHLHHIAAETVHTLAAPVAHNLVHLVPSLGVEITVIQPDGLVPIIYGRGGRETVAGSLGRVLVVCLAVERQP